MVPECLWRGPKDAYRVNCHVRGRGMADHHEPRTRAPHSVSQSVSLLHSHIDKVVNMQTKYIELDLRVYVCVR